MGTTTAAPDRNPPSLTLRCVHSACTQLCGGGGSSGRCTRGMNRSMPRFSSHLHDACSRSRAQRLTAAPRIPCMHATMCTSNTAGRASRYSSSVVDGFVPPNLSCSLVHTLRKYTPRPTTAISVSAASVASRPHCSSLWSVLYNSTPCNWRAWCPSDENNRVPGTNPTAFPAAYGPSDLHNRSRAARQRKSRSVGLLGRMPSRAGSRLVFAVPHYCGMKLTLSATVTGSYTGGPGHTYTSDSAKR